MKIVILNGSPKGEQSITLQHAVYIKRGFPYHDFTIHHISNRIREIEENEKVFKEILEDINSADGVIFALPVYYFLIPYQFKRFIELMWKKKSFEPLRGKYTAVLTTSIHFFDHAAHEYMAGISEDFGMKFVDSFSAGMRDFFKVEERVRLRLFAKTFFNAIEKKIVTSRRSSVLKHSKFAYQPADDATAVSVQKKILIVTDLRDGEANLAGMIHRLASTFSPKPEIFNINDIAINGGCTGCLTCGYDNHCIYETVDSYSEFYKHKMQTADAIIFAGCIKDRYLSSRWKLFFDRAFFYNHVPSLAGKQIAFLISGPLRQLPNLRQILETYAEVVKSNLVGIVTDEDENSANIDSLIDEMAKCAATYMDTGYIRPYTCLSIGARKILRDEIWGHLRFIFQADDRYYVKHGMYDFPQRNVGARLFNVAIILITKILFIRKIVMKDIKGKMVGPYRKIVDKLAEIENKV